MFHVKENRSEHLTSTIALIRKAQLIESKELFQVFKHFINNSLI